MDNLLICLALDFIKTSEIFYIYFILLDVYKFFYYELY